MRNAILTIGAIAASVTLFGQLAPLHAGTKSTGTVTFSDFADGTHAIRGSFGGTRNSSNAVEYLSCRVDSRSDGGRSAFCSAKNSAGTTRTCNTTNATLIDAMMELDEEYIDLFYDANGVCTTIFVTNGSQYAGKST